MTFAERVHAIAEKGFTERQAGFLVTVMLHSGVCVRRQVPASTLGLPTARRTTIFLLPLWQRNEPHRTRRRIDERTSTTCTTSPSTPRLESRTTATANPLRSPAP